MDHATELSQRLKQYAATLAAANRQTDDHSIEEWLGFWNDDDSVYGNMRNIEHWLSQTLRTQQS